MQGIDFDICRTQQDLYRYAALKNYDMEKFSDGFLRSSFCSMSMDCEYSRFQLSFPEELCDFIIPEIGPESELLSKDGTWFNIDVAGWIGFIYRLLHIYSKMPSEKIVSYIHFKDMCACYPGMHTIDEEQAAEIILEEKMPASFMRKLKK